jgi:hypothetical protein
MAKPATPAPRCGQRTQVRAHREITEKQLRQPFYYSRWFVCTNPRCRTTLIMPERFKVFRDEPEPVSSADDDIVMAVLAENDKPPWEE